MKKLLLFLSMCFVIGPIYGQIPNSSFETWVSTAYDEPAGFQTGNHESASLGLIPVTKINGTSGFAVRMQTLVSNGDTAQAYIANGDPKGTGGIPYAEQPTAITGFYRYNLPANDTAILFVIFKKDGTPVSSDVFKIKGTGTQNTFTAFSFPLTLAVVPDSVIIAAASSNLIDNVGVENGSFLELDGLSFAGAITPIFNGTFETWDSHSNDAISGWETYGDGFTRTSDSYDGNYAASLTTVDYGNGNISSSGMTTGQNSNFGSVGGTPFTNTVDTLTGYYKYFTSAPDSASINISLMQNSNTIGGSGASLPAAAQYTYFEIPIFTNNAPDTMRIDINSSKWPYSPSSVGSTLYIDHLQLKSELTAGIQTAQSKIAKNIFSFPNPANDVLHVKLANSFSDNVLVEIFDLSGRLIVKETKKVSDNTLDIRTVSLKAGSYLYRISNHDGKYEQLFSKE